MEGHITPQMILRLADGTLEPEELGPLLVYHAIEICPVCRQVFLMAQKTLGPKLRRDLFETVTDLSSWLDPETLRQQAEEDLAELLRLSPEERRLRLSREDVRFRSPLLVQLLLSRARHHLGTTPSRALDLSDLALEVAFRIDPELAGNLAHELVALAATYKGNAILCCRQPELARACFTIAERTLNTTEDRDEPDEAVPLENGSVEPGLNQLGPDRDTEPGITQHLQLSHLRRLLDGLDCSLAPSLLAHLLEVCESCSLNLISARALVDDAVTDNKIVLRRTVQYVHALEDPQAPRREAERELSDLLPLSLEERRCRLACEKLRFRNPSLAMLALEQSRSYQATEPARALDLARLAFDVAARVDEQVYGKITHEVTALAAAHKANAWRCLNQRWQAESCFRTAYEELALVEYTDPTIEAEVLSLDASLRTDQRRFEHVWRLLHKAEGLLRCSGDDHQRAVLLTKQSHLLYYQCGYQNGIDKLHEAAELAVSGSMLELALQHNMARYLCEAGDASGAREVLNSHHERLVGTFGPWTPRLPWLYGRLAELEGDFDIAEKGYVSTHFHFLEHGAIFDAAEATLDLALLYLKQGRKFEVRRLAREMLVIYESQGVEREVYASHGGMVKENLFSSLSVWHRGKRRRRAVCRPPAG